MDKAGLAKGFEIIPDAASARLRVWGRTVKDAFRNAVRGLALFVHPNTGEITKKTPKESQEIAVHAVDINSLLVTLLSEVVARGDSESAVFTSISFTKFGENFLEGKLSGVKIAGFAPDIKEVSYEGVDIRKNPETGLYETMLVLEA